MTQTTRTGPAKSKAKLQCANCGHPRDLHHPEQFKAREFKFKNSGDVYKSIFLAVRAGQCAQPYSYGSNNSIAIRVRILIGKTHIVDRVVYFCNCAEFKEKA